MPSSLACACRWSTARCDAGRAAERLRQAAPLALLQDRAAIPRLLPEGWRYADKTGSNPDLRADAAILFGPERQQLVMVAFCAELTRADWGVDNLGLIAIARPARALVLRGAADAS